MPNVTNKNTIAQGVKTDAIDAGMSPAQLQQLGQKLMQLQLDVSGYLPGLEAQLDDLAGGVLLAAQELAANTQSDAGDDSGVTA